MDGFSRNLRHSERDRRLSDRRRGDRSHSPPRRQEDYNGWRERDYPARNRSAESRRDRKQEPERRHERRERSPSSRATESSYEDMEDRRSPRKRRRDGSRSRRSVESGDRRRDADESSSTKKRRRRGRRKRGRRNRRSGSSNSHASSEAPADESNRNVVVSDSNEDDYSSETFTPHKASRSKRTAAKKDKPRSASKDRDDVVGHFEGNKGAVIAHRYKILREVGLGTFGRVVECLDLNRRQRRDNNAFVALKIVRNVKRYHESALIEARIVSEVNRRGGRGQTHCVVLHDAFSFQGHYCMVFESLGPSLYDFLKRHNYQPFPMACVQDFTVQLLETLEFLHSFRLIHTDLKIENILLMNDREVNYGTRRVPESTKIKIIDFGGSCYDSDKKSSIIQTRQYRSPEVVLQTGWDMSSDMWSLGCILAELYQGELLFATHDNIEHLALIEQIIGRFPRRMIAKAAENGGQESLVKQAFDSRGRHRLGKVLSSENASFVVTSARLEQIVKNRDDLWFLDLLRMILVIDPADRATAHECLQFLSRIRKDVVRYN